MRHLFNIINMGYITHMKKVKVIFKKKYISILEKLLRLNIISNFTIKKYVILIELRYFMNKPLFSFLLKSKPGNKLYNKISYFYTKKYNYHSTLTLFSTSVGILTKEESIYKNMGGEFLCEILFLKNNFK